MATPPVSARSNASHARASSRCSARPSAEHGCPHDCGICPEHAQHTCLGIIEVNTACNLDCPICFADSGPGPPATASR